MLKDERIAKILYYYGKQKQKMKAVEELTELSEKIIKDVNKGECEGITEEVADVYVMLSQLELIYEIQPVILKQIINEKLDRQEKRMRAGL